MEKDKDAVAEWIYSQVKQDGDKMPIGSYGYIFSRFGSKYTCGVEPLLYKNEKEQVRLHAVYILRNAAKNDEKAVDILLKALENDLSHKVKAECIGALNNLWVKEADEKIIKYLNSDSSELRMNAIQFFWSHQSEKALEPLKARLDKENEYDAGYWLSLTLCKYPNFTIKELITHKNAGIRCGALASAAKQFQNDKEVHKIIVDRLDLEKDAPCRYMIALCLAEAKEPRCVPIFIETLKEKKNSEYSNIFTDLRVSASSRLGMLTELPFYVTDDDLWLARYEKFDRYARVAKLYEEYWEANKTRIHYDEKKYQFVVKE